MVFFTMLSAVILFVAIWYYRTSLSQEHGEVLQYLSSVAELKVSELENWRAERVHDAELLQYNPFLYASVEKLLSGSAEAEADILPWLRKFREAYGHDRITLVDREGRSLLQDPVDSPPISAFFLAHVRTCFETKDIHFQDFYRSTSNGKVYLALVVPICGSPHHPSPRAAVVIRIDPERYLFPMIKKWPSSSETAETLILRREGNEAVFLNELRFRSNTTLRQRIPVDRTEVPGVRAALGWEGTMEGIDYRGEPVLAAIKRIPHSPWGLVARIDITEAEEPVRQQLWLVFLLAGSLILAMGTGVRYAWKRRQWSYAHEKLATAELLWESEKKFSTAFHTTTAGMAITSTNGTTVEVNETYARMVGIPRENLQGKSLQEIGLHISSADRTWDGERPPEDHVMSRIPGTLVRSDGVLRNILWTREIMRSGGVPHFLNIILDVTEQVRLQKERERYHTRTRLLLELHQHAGDSPDTLLEYALRASLETTESTFCWIGTLDAEETVVTIHKWSDGVMEKCAVQDAGITFPVSKAGYWGECLRQRRPVIINHYEAPHPAKKGIPDGHVDIERFLGVPVIDQGRVVLIALVANKESDYTDDDAVAFTTLMTKAWEILRRKQMEEEVRDAREQFELFMHHFPGAAFIKDEKLKTVFVNRFMVEYLDAGAWVGKGSRDFFPAEIATMLDEADRKAMADEVVTYEESFATSDGRLRDFETTKFLIRRSNKPSMLGGIATDITPRKEAEKAMARYYQQITTKASIDRAILGADSHEQLLATVLPLVRDLVDADYLGLHKRDEADPSDFSQEYVVRDGALVPRHHAPPAGLLARLVQGTVIHTERDSVTEDDDVATACLVTMEYPCHLHLPLMAQQELLGILTVGSRHAGYATQDRMTLASDIANQLAVALRQIRMAHQIRRHANELEDRVRERTAELEAANAELEAFAYSVSHDLRSPLRAISGFVQILREEYLPRLDDEGARLLSVITSNTKRMDQLISDLLKLSQVTRGELKREPVDMRALVLASFDESAPDDILATFQLELGELPQCHGDEYLLRQVWQNLISNAIKFSMTSTRRHITISGCTREANVEYTISDRGVGFNQNYVHKLFGVFNRLHSMHEFPGTGVGLATVYRIVQRHGGRIWAEGKEGQGAIFTFTIPIQGARP